MNFKDWFLGENPLYQMPYNGQWGILHISIILGSIVAIIVIWLLFKNKSKRTKEVVVFILAMIILLFEILRRVKNLMITDLDGLNTILYILLPRPWCAISCWMIIGSVFIKKKFFYNITAASSLLCALIFFAYPIAGFDNYYILFENLYSIVTHVLLLIISISMITLKIVDFRYIREKDSFVFELLILILMYLYAFLEINVLKIATDPLYFMPANDVMKILDISYPIYLVCYTLFLLIWFNSFYLISYYRRKKIYKNHESRIV